MGVSNLGDLVATAQLDISPFIGNTRQLQLYLRGVDNALKTSENSVKGYSNKLSGLRQVYDQTGMALNDYRKLLDKQTVAFNNAKKEVGDLETASSENKQTLVSAQSAMMATASRVAELQNKYNALGKEIASLSSRWLSFGNELSKSGEELTKIGNKASGVGEALTLGLTTPIVSGVGYITKLAIEYESAFAGVKKTVDETSTTSYEKLSKDFREMSKTLPATASDIARVAEVAGQLGIEADNITSFTKVMIDLGESTNLSATSAAESLAKFANITKLAPENYSRLGASIVDLGNNFATTEEDITAMAMRLAGAGTQIGLSQADIIGLAGALSSIGIEAEMGGSAFSKVMVKMQLASTSGAKGMDELIAKTGLSRREFELMLANSPRDFKKLADSIGMTSTEMSNIVKASANLDDFARISGMTADEFVQKFEKDAVGAIGAFINGLGNAEESGESAIEMLTEMGFTEVRLRDSLLRAGNAQDLFSRAVGMSNNAWEKNTALTNEANKRYETTASKIKMLRNEATDTAIEFGGPLVDALRESLDVVRPWISSASDMAKAFNDLDKEQQQQIIKWGLIAVGIGPALTVFGKATSVIGATHKGLGSIIKSINTVSTALKVGKPAVEGLGVASATTASSATGLVGAIGTLGSPYTWGVLLGGTALLAIGVIATEMGNARQRTLEWGTEVDKVQSRELSKLKEKIDDTNFAMDAFANSKDGVEQVKGSVEKVKQAFDELAISINKSLDEQFNEDIDLAKKYGFSDEAIADMQRQNEQVKSNIIDMSEQVKAIYEKHGGDMSKLSQAENDLILRNQQEMISKQLDQMQFSNEEKKALQAVLNNELDKLNSMQLEKVITNTDKMTKKENETYQKNKDELLALMESYGDKQSIAYKEAKKKLEDLEADHNLKISAYNEQWLKTQKARIDDMKANGESSEQIALRQLDVIDEIMERYGVGRQRAEDMLNSAITTGTEISNILSNISADASEQVKNANEAWDSLFTSDNPSEKLKEMIGSVEGWNQFKIMVKDVDVNPIGRLKLAEMLVESGKWNEMTYAEKQLVVDGSTAMREIFDSKELLAQWNALTPEQKVIAAENKVREPTMTAQQMIDSVKQSKSVDIKASDRTSEDVNRAKGSINSIPNRHVSLTASDGISSTVDGINYKLRTLENRRVNVNIDPNIGHLATGTNYHPGGLAVVNDQKGSTYRELISLPNGQSFIPEGRDIMLPLPKGTKVLKASDTKKLFPHYADGIGFENTRIARLTERMRTIPEEKITATYQSDNKEVKQLLAQLLSLTGHGTELMSQIVRGVNDIYDKESYMVLDDGTLVAETGNKFAKHFSNIERRNKRLRGEPYD